MTTSIVLKSVRGSRPEHFRASSRSLEQGAKFLIRLLHVAVVRAICIGVAVALVAAGGGAVFFATAIVGKQ